MKDTLFTSLAASFAQTFSIVHYTMNPTIITMAVTSLFLRFFPAMLSFLLSKPHMTCLHLGITSLIYLATNERNFIGQIP